MNKIYYDGNLTDFVIRLGQMVFCDRIFIVLPDYVELTNDLIECLYFWTDKGISIQIIFEYNPPPSAVFSI
jgi:hypothetical protein